MFVTKCVNNPKYVYSILSMFVIKYVNKTKYNVSKYVNVTKSRYLYYEVC